MTITIVIQIARGWGGIAFFLVSPWATKGYTLRPSEHRRDIISGLSNSLFEDGVEIAIGRFPINYLKEMLSNKGFMWCDTFAMSSSFKLKTAMIEIELLETPATVTSNSADPTKLSAHESCSPSKPAIWMG